MRGTGRVEGKGVEGRRRGGMGGRSERKEGGRRDTMRKGKGM